MLKRWGRECIVIEDEKYNVKYLWLKRGKQHHLKYHWLKTETLFVMQGTGFIVCDGKFFEINTGDVVTVLPKVIHKVWASITEDLLLLEVNNPSIEESVCLEI